MTRRRTTNLSSNALHFRSVSSSHPIGDTDSVRAWGGSKHPAASLRRLTWASCSLAALAACNSFDPAPREGAGLVRVAPIDERTPVTSAKPVAPVMGSNLLALEVNPDTVFVSDADRDRVSFVSGDAVVHVLTGEGTRPNRAAEDAAGFIHVSLRGTGELLMVHPSGEVVARSEVCQAPRGLDFDAKTAEVVVACAEGQLVRHSTDPTNYAPTSFLETEVDLRDVVVLDDRVYVSRMRSAEVLEFRGTEVLRHPLPTVELDNSLIPTERAGSRLQPSVAWKMIATPENDGVVVLHQRSLLNAVEDVPSSSDTGGSSTSSSPYGGSDPTMGCSGIVQPAVSEVRNDGTVVTSDSIAGVVLAVDLVADARFDAGGAERSLVFAAAGVADPEAPRSHLLALNGAAADDQTPPSLLLPNNLQRNGVVSGNVRLHGLQATNPRTGDVLVGCTSFSEAFVDQGEAGPTVSVARTSTGELVALQRGPNVLMRGQDAFFSAESQLALGGDSVLDTGHELFHRDSGGGIACASCHPEAEDDGHVWTFASVGARRTQFLGVHLSQTAPFHWDGALPNLNVLMDDVFVTRMGGVFQSEQRVEVLGHWLGNLPPAAVAPRRESAEAARGRTLFESEEVGCASCHSGEALTNNQSHNVGTAGSSLVQTPSLLHVSLHPPFMHDGCAKTLRERFEPGCGGGDAHGRTSQLTEDQVDDLVAYLNTL